MMPAKMELWCDIRNVEKATAKMRPRYLARSPMSICSATKFMIPSFLCELRISDERCSPQMQKKTLLVRLEPHAFHQRLDHAVDQAILLDKREPWTGD